MATHNHHHHSFLLRLLSFLTLLLLLSAADDSAVMLKLLSSLSPAPSGWSSDTHFCKWNNVICDSTSSFVTSINLHNAGVSGTLPPELNQLSQLQFLALQKNSLTGTLPSFENMTSLKQIYLHDNDFTSVPNNFLLGLTSLRIFSINENINLGPWEIPSYLTESTNLVTFYAGNASITGIIPDIFGSFPNLQNLRLSHNKLSGSLPGSFSGSKIQELWLNNQRVGLSGGIDVLANMTQLAQVWLHANMFSGAIPDLSTCKDLFDLQLGDNNLTGAIPSALTILPRLQIFDVSNNNLSGPSPVFPSRVRFTYGGNSLLGSNHRESSGGGSGTAPGMSPGNIDGSSNRTLGRSIVAGIIAVVIVVAVVTMVALFALYKCYVKRKHKRFGRVEESQHREIPVFEGGNVLISIQVLRQATSNFSTENALGRGGFGVVYKGELHDGTKIAVKRMETGAMGTKRMKEFQAEIAVLTKVRHRHLVALLGYCINGNERLLVYEYMPQGTLGQHLFQWQELCYQPLTWKHRLIIALDVARGVEYLHSLAQQSFIHRDLKPSNILLSDDMRAKVADFGLVKNATDGNYSLETRLAGTFGYLAPEYTATGKVTTKVDVYAFGVVLMEIITGRKAVDETVSEERSHLVTWFRMVLINKDNLRKSIDPILNPDDETYESICKVVALASRCTTRKPTRRPDMGHVVNVLGPLVERWKSSKPEEDDAYGVDHHMSLPQRWQADEEITLSAELWGPRTF